MTAEPYYPKRYSNAKISPINGQSSAFFTSPAHTGLSRTSLHFCAMTDHSKASGLKMSSANGGATPVERKAFEIVFFKDFVRAASVIFSSSVVTNRCN